MTKANYSWIEFLILNLNSNTAAYEIMFHIKAVNSNGREATIDPEVDENDTTRRR